MRPHGGQTFINFIMYRKFWTAGIAKRINVLYNTPEKSNLLERVIKEDTRCQK